METPTLESRLIAEYRRARIAFALAPSDWRAYMAMASAAEALADFIRSAGCPAEDWANFTRFELDSNGEIQEMPLMFERFRAWSLYGAASVSCSP